MILLPLPFDNSGKSATGKTSILFMEVNATKSAVEFLQKTNGGSTLAFSGRE